MSKRSQRIVLKFGSGILSTEKGLGLSRPQIARLAREVGALVRAGHQCVIVSSGAVAAGLAALDLTARPKELAAKQACAAVGQSQLMHAYASEFAKQDIAVAQLLGIRVGVSARVAVEAVEVVRARDVGPIEEAATTPVGKLEAELELVTLLDPDQAVGQLRVDLCENEVALAAARERARDDGAWLARGAEGRLTLVPDEDLELMQQGGAERRLLSEGDLLLMMRESGPGRRQGGAAHAPVLALLVLVCRP